MDLQKWFLMSSSILKPLKNELPVILCLSFPLAEEFQEGLGQELSSIYAAYANNSLLIEDNEYSGRYKKKVNCLRVTKVTAHYPGFRS